MRARLDTVRSRLLRSLPVVVVAVAVGGCRDRGVAVASDAAVSRDTADSSGAGDTLGAPLALDIAVTGCAQFDVASYRCVGLAPLTVAFSPVTSGVLDSFLWNFGDGSAMSTERAPVHTYQLVGAYDVMVTASGPAGAIPRVRKDLVEVAAGALGATCDVDAHCAMGLACLCGSATTCPAAFSRGLCSVACSDGACPAGAVCADLSPPAGSPGANLPAPWQRPSCLAACSRDADCGPGLSCRDLPARAAATDASAPPPSSPLSWVKGCFPPYPLDVGSPCRAADGHLRSDVCASGDCIDFGSAGLCTAPCLTDADCPSATVCATFGDGRALCLRSCAGVAVCTVDPLLDCESPGAAGPLGFTVAGAVNNPTATYCAPRGCISAVNCSPAGVCAGGITAGHCVSQ